MRVSRIGRGAACALALGMMAMGAGAAQAAPGDMSVAEFLRIAHALEAKGMMALFSGDIKKLTSEAKAATTAYRQRLAEERKAGHPSSCPPDKATLSSKEIIDHLDSYPAATRANVTMTTAFGDFFAKKFPCR